MHVCSDRLSAQDVLSIRKVREYVYDKLHPDNDGEAPEGRGSNIDVFCADQVSSTTRDVFFLHSNGK